MNKGTWSLLLRIAAVVVILVIVNYLLDGQVVDVFWDVLHFES